MEPRLANHPCAECMGGERGSGCYFSWAVPEVSTLGIPPTERSNFNFTIKYWGVVGQGRGRIDPAGTHTLLASSGAVLVLEKGKGNNF